MASTPATRRLPSPPSALDAFMVQHARMGELLEALTAHHEDHLDAHPDTLHWGHVGTAGKAVQDLEALCQFLGLKV